MPGFSQTKNGWEPVAEGQSPLELQKSADDAAYQRTMDVNRPNQKSDYSNTSWTYDPDTASYVQKTQLNGPLAGANQNLQKQWSDMLAKPMDDGTAARNQAIDASYGQATSRLDPQWDKRSSATQTQLMNQGLDPSSEAYKSAMQDFGNQRNDAYSSAMNTAIGQGTAAGDSAFKNNLAARNNPLQLMEGMQGLTKQNAFNPMGSAPTEQWLNSAIAENNSRIGQATQMNQNAADTAQGVGSAVQALGMLAMLA